MGVSSLSGAWHRLYDEGAPCAVVASAQIAVVSRLTALVAEAAGVPSLADRTWVLLTEAPDGVWGLVGHANTNEELIAAARAQLTELRASAPPG
jgi:phenylpyruvate tautomerase PptA (4-oxalocrotonate tautomerase family)